MVQDLITNKLFLSIEASVLNIIKRTLHRHLLSPFYKCVIHSKFTLMQITLSFVSLKIIGSQPV